jgi:hypothetical protein
MAADLDPWTPWRRLRGWRERMGAAKCGHIAPTKCKRPSVWVSELPSIGWRVVVCDEHKNERRR